MGLSPLFSRDPAACEPKATFTLVLVAILTAACRSAWSRGAPCERMNVALLERSGDTATGSMSHLPRMRSDMSARACRTGPAPGATSQPLHVARRGLEGRHTRGSVSPLARVQCDMQRR